MNTQRAAEIQAMLEGIRLPATRDELIAYAMRWDPSTIGELSTLPDRSYKRIDEVGEELVRVQPRSPAEPSLPRPESGKPPGGESYVDPNPQSGEIRYSAPPDNPPQKAIEQASKLQKRQAAVQKT
jgi:hypothetical protein